MTFDRAIRLGWLLLAIAIFIRLRKVEVDHSNLDASSCPRA